MRCDYCHAPLRWKRVYLANWTYGPVQCDQCALEYKITFSSRFIVTGLTVLPMLVFLYFLSSFHHVFLNIITSIGMAIAGSLMASFMVKYERI